MTDAHLRDLERQYRLTGLDEDRLAWLHGRARQGEWPLDEVLDELRAHRAWLDVDETMELDDVEPGLLALAVWSRDPQALAWLTYFVALRALPIWVLQVADPGPQRVLAAVEAHLRHGEAVDWASITRPIRTPHNGCTVPDTQGAADAVVHCARYVLTGDPLQAAYCLGGALCAYAHVFTDDRFKEWVLDVALPVALERRPTTPTEQEALRAAPIGELPPTTGWRGWLRRVFGTG